MYRIYRDQWRRASECVLSLSLGSNSDRPLSGLPEQIAGVGEGLCLLRFRTGYHAVPNRGDGISRHAEMHPRANHPTTNANGCTPPRGPRVVRSVSCLAVRSQPILYNRHQHLHVSEQPSRRVFRQQDIFNGHGIKTLIPVELVAVPAHFLTQISFEVVAGRIVISQVKSEDWFID
jgi:hypothetical protein